MAKGVRFGSRPFARNRASRFRILWRISGTGPAPIQMLCRFGCSAGMTRRSGTEQLDFFYGFPVWVVACWALAVWGAVAGSILLLMRRRWAVAVFSVSLGAMVITYLHNFVLAETKMQDVVGREAIWFSLVIAIFAVAVFFYALAMAQRGVLR